jgi:vacuolar-type H+-ATPase subunit E/Vma4
MTDSDLDGELRRSAERTMASILGSAKEEAEQLASEADETIGSRRRAVMEDKAAQYRSEARVATAGARHSAMQAVLIARTSLVDRVLEQARALLPALAENEKYLSELSDEVSTALQFVESDGAILRCAPALEPPIREALLGRPEVKVESSADVGTGFVLRGADGSVVVDGRLEGRLERLSSTLAIEIHARLEEL